jgi:hypothetical protein
MLNQAMKEFFNPSKAWKLKWKQKPESTSKLEAVCHMPIDLNPYYHMD